MIDSGETLKQTSGMNGQRTGLAPAWRWIALVTLFAWVSAFGLCAAHCSLGKSAPFNTAHADADAPPACHGGPAKPASDSKTPGSFCLMMKSLFSQESPLTIVPPDAPELFQPVLISYASRSIPGAPDAPILRHADPPERRFTPEVYLGPAFRAHAPPVLA